MVYQTQIYWLFCMQPVFMKGLFASSQQSHFIDSYLFLTNNPRGIPRNGENIDACIWKFENGFLH